MTLSDLREKVALFATFFVLINKCGTFFLSRVVNTTDKLCYFFSLKFSSKPDALFEGFEFVEQMFRCTQHHYGFR